MTPEAMAALHARVFRGRKGWEARDIAAILAAPGSILTANDHAFALGRAIADEAELLLIVTDPNHQRQGHASRCLEDFERQAQTTGARAVFLEVAKGDSGARAFYATHGYTEIARRENYYRTEDGTRAAALILSRDLKPD